MATMASDRLEFFVPSNRVDKRGRPTHMDGINDIVGAARANAYLSAKKKREDTEWVASFARRAMRDGGWAVPSCPVSVETIWYETSPSRDLDNVYGGVKYVLDALCTPARWSEKRGTYTRNPFGCGAIVDDSRKFVSQLAFGVMVDKRNPGVLVRVEKLPERPMTRLEGAGRPALVVDEAVFGGDTRDE